MAMTIMNTTYADKVLANTHTLQGDLMYQVHQFYFTHLLT